MDETDEMDEMNMFLTKPFSFRKVKKIESFGDLSLPVQS